MNTTQQFPRDIHLTQGNHTTKEKSKDLIQLQLNALLEKEYTQLETQEKNFTTDLIIPKNGLA